MKERFKIDSTLTKSLVPDDYRLQGGRGEGFAFEEAMAGHIAYLGRELRLYKLGLYTEQLPAATPPRKYPEQVLTQASIRLTVSRQVLTQTSIRLTDSQQDTLARLGGNNWIRPLLDTLKADMDKFKADLHRDRYQINEGGKANDTAS